MLETLTELVAAHPMVVLGALAGGVFLYVATGAADWILGQPRRGNRFDEYRQKKVKRLYRRLAFGLVVAVALYAAMQAGFV